MTEPHANKQLEILSTNKRIIIKGGYFLWKKIKK